MELLSRYSVCGTRENGSTLAPSPPLNPSLPRYFSCRVRPSELSDRFSRTHASRRYCLTFYWVVVAIAARSVMQALKDAFEGGIKYYTVNSILGESTECRRLQLD